MTKLLISFFITLFMLTLCGSISLASAETKKTYQWNDFTLTYPTGWEIKINKRLTFTESGNTQLLQLTSKKGEDQIAITLSIMEGAAAKDIYHENYEEMPVLTSLAYGLGQALKLAGDDGEDAIAITYRSLVLSSGSALSTFFTVMPRENKDRKVSSLECFHQFSRDKKKIFMGTLITVTERGGANTRPSYSKLIQEAYAIIRSAEFKN